MKVIKAINENGGIRPETPIPSSAVKVVCDGQNYLVYEEGDIIPDDVPVAPLGTFLGVEVYDTNGVKRTVAEAIAGMFSASQGNIDTVSDQFKIVSEMIAIQFAKCGWLAWTELGISGVTDEASAQAHFNINIKPLWDKRNGLRLQAKQFIQGIGYV